MSVIELNGPEEEDLYLLLKGREGRLSEGLLKLLQRVERSLFERLTVEEMERLEKRSGSER